MEQAQQQILARQWFDAHETVEDLWRVAEGPYRQYLQGLIHVLVSLEHLRRGNPSGCHGQWRKAQTRLKGTPPTLVGIEIDAWMKALTLFYTEIDLDGAARKRSLPPDLPDSSLWPIPQLSSEEPDGILP